MTCLGKTTKTKQNILFLQNTIRSTKKKKKGEEEEEEEKKKKKKKKKKKHIYSLSVVDRMWQKQSTFDIRSYMTALPRKRCSQTKE